QVNPQVPSFHKRPQEPQQTQVNPQVPSFHNRPQEPQQAQKPQGRTDAPGFGQKRKDVQFKPAGSSAEKPQILRPTGRADKKK
ncbi:MAG: hypothetical protein IKR21_01950, partial [Oscillospiraceae bacterium]|nr:hypothetical protein [Oscillospiraceae bacterium]